MSLAGCTRSPHRAAAPPTGTLSSLGYTPPKGYITHIARRGDTLYRLSKLYKVDLGELMRANGISDPRQLDTGQQLRIPQKNQSVQTTAAQPDWLVLWKPRALSHAYYSSSEDVQRVVGDRRTSYLWRTITLHHSATHQGNARLFDRDHRRRRMGGLFYHFVIGNSHGSGDGEIEVGWRWREQVKSNRPYDIQICLVGNFSQEQVSDAQFDTLFKLVQLLQSQYGVPTSHIRRHEDVRGKRTECPGRNFPFGRLLSKLKA